MPPPTKGRYVSLDFAVPLKLLKQPLHDSIDELRAGYRALSECVEQAVAECEQRGAALDDCRRQLAEARRSLLEQEKLLAQRTGCAEDTTRRLTEQSEQLEAIRAELAESLEKASHAQASESESRQRFEVQQERVKQLEAQLGRSETTEAELRKELGQLREQLGPLTEATVDAARLRGELATAQQELAAVRMQLETKDNQPDLSEQLAAETAERQQVELELDQLRHRAAELAEALAEQKKLVSEERDQWSDELRLLRRAVDRQAELMVHRPTAATTTDTGPASTAAVAAPRHPANGKGEKSDQVMDNVVKQFEMLQQKKVRRVAKTSK